MIKAKSKKLFGLPPKAPQFSRRRKPVEGENLQALKNVMREIEGQRITAEDFILLVAPHTGDKGASLTKTMADDLHAFRRLCNEAYDTMTQDTNEVMATTQIELGKLYAEKIQLLTESMIKCMKLIHNFVPDFHLEDYYKDPDKYLATKFHIVDQPDEAEVESARRQLAYHRLHWLRDEGDRLSAENNKLQQRLNELKKIQRNEIAEQVRKEREADAQRKALEQQQAEMQAQLENLVDELLETIVSEEKKSTDLKKVETRKKLTKKAPAKKGAPKVDSKWSVKAAHDIEKHQIQDAASATTVSSTPTSSSSLPRLKAPVSSKFRQFRQQQQQHATSTPYISPSVSSSAASECACKGAIPKVKAPAPVKRKKAKKPTPICQRPVWQDVAVEEFEAAPCAAEHEPIDIMSIGRSGAPPHQRQTQRQSPVMGAGCCGGNAPPPPAPRYASPPRQIGRRVAGPRDSWSGFG